MVEANITEMLRINKVYIEMSLLTSFSCSRNFARSSYFYRGALLHEKDGDDEAV